MVWIKWVLFATFKSVIEIPFILCGPIALIAYWTGWDFAGLGLSQDSTVGCFICCVFSIPCTIDWIFSIFMPWIGGTGDSFPVWWEDADAFGRSK